MNGELMSDLREAVRSLASGIAEPGDSTEFDRAAWAALSAQEATAWCVPEGLGGNGNDPCGPNVVIEELAAANLSVAASLSAHFMASAAIGQALNAGELSAELDGLTSGERIGAFALTEPAGGSDLRALNTTLSRQGDAWVLNGEKALITNSSIADLAVIVARAPELTAGADSSYVGVVVSTDQDGVTVSPPESKMGLAQSPTGSISFSDVVLDDRSVLKYESASVLSVLQNTRIFVASSAIGAMRRCIDEAVSYAGARESMGRPIGEYQLVQGLLADMFVAYESSRALRDLYLGQSCVDGGVDRVSASVVKLHSTESAARVADLAVQIWGALGVIRGNVVERYYRDVRALRIYEGTSEVQRASIGRIIQRTRPWQ
jgi:acyl-CoA dehydrogenase